VCVGASISCSLNPNLIVLLSIKDAKLPCFELDHVWSTSRGVKNHRCEQLVKQVDSLNTSVGVDSAATYSSPSDASDPATGM